VQIVIRKANLEDIFDMVEARRTSASDNETNGFRSPDCTTYLNPEEFRKVWDKENRLKDSSEVFVAEEAGHVIAFIVFIYGKTSVLIEDLYVAGFAQRKGIGRLLVNFVEELAKAKGYENMETDTTMNSGGTPWKSYDFWTNMGYRDTGKRLPTKWSFRMIPLVKKLDMPKSNI
jgi:GNAT superfamily N-acetyltransferase